MVILSAVMPNYIAEQIAQIMQRKLNADDLEQALKVTQHEDGKKL